MAEGEPPHSGIHPMRAIFMIPSRPPPTLSAPEKWSDSFNEFIAQCLRKNPNDRPSAKHLLKHPFIRKTQKSGALNKLVDLAFEKIQEAGGDRASLLRTSKSDDEDDSGSDGSSSSSDTDIV